MKLWMVRHGRTEANADGLLLGRADIALDDVGREQADQIAAAIPEPDRIITSPLLRTRQTAAAFGDVVEVDERLVEVDYGDFDLRPVDSVPAQVWKEWRSNVDFCPPQGESMAQMFKRVASALDSLSAEPVDGHVVVVSHVSPIKASLCWALGVGPEHMIQSWVAQASITQIDVGIRGRSLHGFNSIAHLT